MNLIAALSALSIVIGATASGAADHPSLRHIRSLGADACAMDVKECEDGSFLNRDPDNNCEFALCPEEELACTMDVFDCGNDTFASRDPAKNCEFEACPKECTGEDGETYMAPCEGIDGMFCIGESYTALDGCNTCKCGDMDGLAACTAKLCPPEENVAPKDKEPKTCLVNGLEINAGESYVASDGCNTCTCTDSGVSACTLMACEPCSTCDGDDGNEYCAGEAFLSGDGCNTCRCSDTGAVSCTKMACPPAEQNTKEMESEVCIVNGIEYAKGETYTHSDGCNTCTCSGGDTPDACTMMACVPCSTCEDGDEVYCSGVSYLASDGCNRCTCGENGLSACTMMACPEPPTPDVMPEVMTKEEDTTSGAISASIGLSTIAAFLSFLGAVVY